MTSNLKERTMLARLHVKQWTASKSLNSFARKIESEEKAKSGSSSYYVKLMECDELDKFKKLVAAGRKRHDHMTSPWLDDGVRLLSLAFFDEYMEEMRDFRQQTELALAAFLQIYPAQVEAEKVRLGNLFTPEAFPSHNEMGHRFSFEARVFPMYDQEDWRLDVGEKNIAEIKANIERQNLELQQAAVKDVWKRVYDSVSHIYEKLSTPEAIFRDSLINNARSLVDIMPKLNFSDDVELENMRVELKTNLLGAEPKALRTDESVRADKAKAARHILDKMQTLGVIPVQGE